MSKGVYVALSGAIAQENALETTATNVANASSPGYQRLRPVFRQELARADKSDRSLRYASASETVLDTSPGVTRVTDRNLDAVLPPSGYLGVETPNGPRFTRGVSLSIGPDGLLKTASGATVSKDSGGPLRVDPRGGEIQLSPDGSVLQGGAAVGKLRVVKFDRPELLVPEGGGLLAVGRAGNVTPMTEPLQVGMVEESNAQPVAAMTELMTASRTFEAFQRVLDTLGEAERKLLTTVPGALE